MRKIILLVLLVLSPSYALAQQSRKVVGIELPESQVVGVDRGLVVVEAKASGNVEWVIVSSEPIEKVEIPEHKKVVISVPRVETVIHLFANTVHENKVTPHAYTSIEVKKQAQQVANKRKLFVTVFVDIPGLDKNRAVLLTSKVVEGVMRSRGHEFHVFDIKSSRAKPFLDHLKNRSDVATVIVQDESGVILATQDCPSNQQEFIDMIEKLSS